MASAEHEPIMGVWGQSPQRSPGAEPLVRGSGGSPLKLTTFRSLDVQRAGKLTTTTNLSYRKQYALLRSTGVRVGGPRVHGAPNPVIGGPVPPPRSAAYGWGTTQHSLYGRSPKGRGGGGILGEDAASPLPTS